MRNTVKRGAPRMTRRKPCVGADHGSDVRDEPECRTANRAVPITTSRRPRTRAARPALAGRIKGTGQAGGIVAAEIVPTTIQLVSAFVSQGVGTSADNTNAQRGIYTTLYYME